MAPVALGVLLAATAASVAPPAPSAADSGEPVAHVRIVAPEAEVPRLRAFVELKAGEPLRPEAVRHAVELFYATGEYEDVRVWVERGAEGLDVVFEPVRAPLLSAVEVDGDALLDPAVVQRQSRLRDREPLWPDRLDHAARDVALALAEAGYLESQVKAEARSTPSGYAAVFHVHAGPLASVARVDLAGDPPWLAGRLRARARPRPGEVYRRARAVSATEDLQRVLREAGYWRATVARRESYDPRIARMGLTFEITPGPRAWLEFRGFSPSSGRRHALESLVREGGARTDALEEVVDRIEEELHRSGHRSVRVVRREEPRPTGLALIYDVQPGPVAIVASVRMVGGDAPAGTRVLATRDGRPLQDRLLAEDARTLAEALQEDGYPDAKVEAEVPEGGGALPVTFRLRTGPRLVVGSVRVETPEPLPAKSGLREMAVRVGAPYRLRDMAQDRDNLLSAYRDAGYPQVEVTPEVHYSEEQDQAEVVLHVAPGQRVTVDHVIIAGLVTTREEVVRRELQVKEGEPLGLRPLLDSQRRLSGLGIFDRVSLTEMDPESTPSRSVVVSAQEAARTTSAFGIGFSERDLLRGSAEVTRRNLFGMDRSLTTFARVSFRGLRLLTTFREPYAFGRRQELFVTGFREEESREAFDFVRYGGLVQAARSLPPGWSAVFRYTYQRTNSFNIVNPDLVGREFTSSTLAGPSSSIINDTRDDALDPHRGRFLSADLQVSMAALGGDSFVKSFLQAATYGRLNGRTVLALSGRLGLSHTFGDEPSLLPRPDRFYAGGDFSLRGFDLDTVGPKAPDSAGRPVATGGNALVLGSAELRMDVGRSIAVAAFSDVGNVYAVVSSLTFEDLRYSAGLGVRYKSPFGPIRLDWGYKLNRRADETAYEFHITLGNAF